MTKIERKTNYNRYSMSIKEYFFYYSISIIGIIMIGILFYNRIILGFIFTPLSYYIVKERKKELLSKQKNELNTQFKDAIYAISSALNAGYSVEMSFKEAYRDLSLIYINQNTPILKELEYIVRQIDVNIPVENLLYDFANRSGVEDIENFADVFITCKKTGGDIIKVIRNTSRVIVEKIEIKREINIVISSKKFEQKIMCLIPFGIILYLWVSSPGFLDVMYNTLGGMITMTICLMVYLLSWVLSKKIMEIEV
ncbi:tight adherence protein B [Natranaerovirga pectinivora]|uniref:Tight adherence protein B n=1 Tax=Natranaerovirga pectinivora TaxID=682400 RepID=A0A4R3MER6_9FIRM|nr:type II secretion system F family protein [Natranaerovirga pectinivora]TCT11652.1 tight adherence protein B [Natranaerovirga pectinivora]